MLFIYCVPIPADQGIMMPKFLIRVEKVNGPCTRGYRQGDEFIFNGYDTPNAFCGGAYTILFPILVALRSGGRFDYEKDPLCKTDMACPDGGHVCFSVTFADRTMVQP